MNLYIYLDLVEMGNSFELNPQQFTNIWLVLIYYYIF